MNDKVVLTAPARGYAAYRSEIDSAVRRVLESGWYILGREVSAFEQAFASYCAVRHAVGVANGTDAIHLALRSLQVGHGDAVFTVSHTATATVAGIGMSGATPVLVDVDELTYTIDLQKLADSIKGYARSGAAGRPRAVVAVHLYGHPCSLRELRALCDQHQLFLIEDCAQAHGATYGSKPVGAFGDAAAFSFYPTKNLAAFGDGGAVVLADNEVAQRCRALREYGWYTRYLSDIPGVNSRLDELQAAILSVRLKHLDAELESRRAVAARYNAELGAAVVTPTVRQGCQHAYHLYVVRAQPRESLRTVLSEHGIGTGIHYPAPVHRQQTYAGTPVGAGGLEVTERLQTQILSLPMHPFLSTSEVTQVVTAAGVWHKQRQTSP